ncbi:MAG: indolepyruvate oxidoreductase subunit beta [Dehalococcoidia bacterium]|nr:indolepyruvate oxidoreductase subunit beta [Dehalococcoidia bacterium]MDH4299553.1 indolepyruvate oxidoreductase subunit beta [Dehalococcoidia bacterium]MDH4366723.1 indolepyruvate oxidoreductase subunit beta [Dehalococcoidia bacterium]
MSKDKLSVDPLNIVVCGVGGQGNILIARLAGRSLAKRGYIVTIGETYGASQRGGDVMSNIRLSVRHRYGPLIPPGGAHIVLGLEPLETLRILVDFGNPQVATITNTRPILPVTVGMGVTQYPDYDELRRAIAQLSRQVWFLDATEVALGLGSVRLTNMVMLGALVGSSLLPITKAQLEEEIKERFPKDTLKPILEAFRKGLSHTRATGCA